MGSRNHVFDAGPDAPREATLFRGWECADLFPVEEYREIWLCMKTKCAAAAVRAVVTISVSTFFNFLETPHSFLAHAGCARRS